MKFSLSKRCILISFLAACAALPAAAATLEGTVLDPSGKPVPGARVSLVRALTVVEERQSDARGTYRFENLREGAYRISAAARGLAFPPADLEIAGDEDRRRDLTLAISALESHVVVSAALGAALAPQIGSSVSLVSGEEIGERGAQNALEVIRGVPGVEVNQSGRRGGVTGVYIRGGESKYNAIMVDGIPVNEFGGSFDMASLPADGIERIEIARGPQSALYGSNAVTGVVNIISRRGDGPPVFTALAEGGSHSTRRFATGGSGLTRGFSWSYNLSRTDSDGVVANDRYRNQSAFLNLGYAQARRQFHFQFFGNANDAGAPGAYGSDPAGTFTGIDTVSGGKQNLFGYQLGYTEQFTSRWRQVTTANLATNDLNYRSMWGDYTSENLRGIFNTRSEILLSARDSVTVGFEFNREQIRNGYITDSQSAPFLLPRTSLAYFAENRWSPSGRFYLITGVRIDHIRTNSMPADAWGSRPEIPESSVVRVNPRVSAALLAHDGGAGGAFGRTRIHGSVGTGIRPPDGFELAFTDNPELKPEKSVSFDAGVEQGLFGDRAVVDVTYFFNRFDDQIVTLGGSMQNLSTYSSDNLKNSRAQGLEIGFRVNPTQSLMLSGQYSLVDTEVLALDGSSEANSPYQVGQRLLRRPRHSAGYGVSYAYRRWTLSTNGYIRGETLDSEPAYGYPFYTNKGYTRADAGVSYRLPGGVELYGRLNNFLNRKYEEVLGYPALKLNFMAGMKFTFNAD